MKFLWRLIYGMFGSLYDLEVISDGTVFLYEWKPGLPRIQRIVRTEVYPLSKLPGIRLFKHRRRMARRFCGTWEDQRIYFAGHPAALRGNGDGQPNFISKAEAAMILFSAEPWGSE